MSSPTVEEGRGEGYDKTSDNDSAGFQSAERWNFDGRVRVRDGLDDDKSIIRCC